MNENILNNDEQFSNYGIVYYLFVEICVVEKE